MTPLDDLFSTDESRAEYFTMNALCKKHGAFFHFKEDFK